MNVQLSALTPWLEKHFPEPIPARCIGPYMGEKPEPPKSMTKKKYRIGYISPKHRA
jgi:hypothetical protein